MLRDRSCRGVDALSNMIRRQERLWGIIHTEMTSRSIIKSDGNVDIICFRSTNGKTPFFMAARSQKGFQKVPSERGRDVVEALGSSSAHQEIPDYLFSIWSFGRNVIMKVAQTTVMIVERTDQ